MKICWPWTRARPFDGMHGSDLLDENGREHVGRRADEENVFDWLTPMSDEEIMEWAAVVRCNSLGEFGVDWSDLLIGADDPSTRSSAADSYAVELAEEEVFQKSREENSLSNRLDVRV